MPKKKFDDVSMEIFIPNNDELNEYRETCKILIARVLMEFLDCFRFLKSVIPDHIPHRFSDEMSKKSTVISMPIIFHSEIEYGEVAQILRTLEMWIEQIYREAGLL